MSVVENSFEKVRRKMVAARIEFISQLAKFSKEELQQKPDEGEWSPLQVAYHVYIVDGLALEQIRHVQNEENPLIAGVEEMGPHLTNISELPASLDVILAGMAARREETYEYLSSLPDEAWVRPCQHKERGQLKFYQFVNVLSMHDQQHAQQLAAIRATKEA